MKKYTLAVGNPFDGIKLFGVYDSADEAVEAADSGGYVGLDEPGLETEWHVVPIATEVA